MSTTETSIGRPEAGEHAPYYSRYVDLVPDGDVVDYLGRQEAEATAFFRSIPPELHDHRYAEGKWSVKEVVGHLADCERVFSYRALRFGRGDTTPIAGFDENLWAANARFSEMDFATVVEEWRSVRNATLALLRGYNADEMLRRGKANDQEVSVRALAWIVAGHVIHHSTLLRERYLGES
jgi:uncharacterized damage-inducible protein DinB